VKYAYFGKGCSACPLGEEYDTNIREEKSFSHYIFGAVSEKKGGCGGWLCGG
jgi:hypothetical protein